MQYTIKYEKYRFMSAFDTKTGAYIRTEKIYETGVDIGEKALKVARLNPQKSLDLSKF